MTIREELRICLTDRGILRASFAVPVVLGLSLLAMWPRGTLETALRIGAVTDTFPVTATCFLLVLLYLGARWGADDILRRSRCTSSRVRDPDAGFPSHPGPPPAGGWTIPHAAAPASRRTVSRRRNGCRRRRHSANAPCAHRHRGGGAGSAHVRTARAHPVRRKPPPAPRARVRLSFVVPCGHILLHARGQPVSRFGLRAEASGRSVAADPVRRGGARRRPAPGSLCRRRPFRRAGPRGIACVPGRHPVTDVRSEFRVRSARLARSARVDLLFRRSTDGLFYGLLPALAIAVLAGTVALPFPVPCAAAAAAVGLMAGALSALLSPLDRRRLLIRADAALGSRELVSTAYELDRSGSTGAFPDAIVEDAAKLLAITTPRSLLGRLRLPLAPFAALAAVLTAAGLLFPVDLRTLVPRHEHPEAALSQIGEDLRKKGQTLAEEARARDLARSLELGDQLAQLGSDLAARRIQPEDALDRMSDIESGLAQEYQLRLQHAQSIAPRPGPGAGGSGGRPGTSREPGASRGEGSPGTSSFTGPEGDQALRDLGGALDRLRQAQRELGGPGPGETDHAQAPSRRQGDLPGRQGSAGRAPGPGGTGDTAQGGRDKGSGSGGAGQVPGKPGPAWRLRRKRCRYAPGAAEAGSPCTPHRREQGAGPPGAGRRRGRRLDTPPRPRASGVDRVPTSRGVRSSTATRGRRKALLRGTRSR